MMNMLWQWQTYRKVRPDYIVKRISEVLRFSIPFTLLQTHIVMTNRCITHITSKWSKTIFISFSAGDDIPMAGNRNKVFPAMSVKRQLPAPPEASRRRSTITRKWDSLEKEMRTNNQPGPSGLVVKVRVATCNTKCNSDHGTLNIKAVHTKKNRCMVINRISV